MRMDTDNKFILESTPVFEEINRSKVYLVEKKVRYNTSITKDEANILLDYLVYECRSILATKYDIVNDSLSNKCDLASNIIGHLLARMGIDVLHLDTYKSLGPGVIRHSVIMALILVDDRINSYLIDITYRQFCLRQYCCKDNYIVRNDKTLLAPDPGYFANIESTRKDTITRLLKKGYLEWNCSTAKSYCDTFYLAKTGKKGKNMSGYDYINKFLKTNNYYSKSALELEYIGTSSFITPFEEHELLIEKKNLCQDFLNQEPIKSKIKRR